MVVEEKKQGVKVVFETWQGELIEVDGEEGESVMDLGKREGLEAMEGVCGGVLEVRFLSSSPSLAFCRRADFSRLIRFHSAGL